MQTVTLVQNSSCVFRAPCTALPPGVTVTQVLLVIKDSRSTPDTSAILTKTITPQLSADGAIYSTASLNGSLMLMWTFHPEETAAIPVGSYQYFFKIWLSNGAVIERPGFSGRCRVIHGGIVTTSTIGPISIIAALSGGYASAFGVNVLSQGISVDPAFGEVHADSFPLSVAIDNPTDDLVAASTAQMVMDGVPGLISIFGNTESQAVALPAGSEVEVLTAIAPSAQIANPSNAQATVASQQAFYGAFVPGVSSGNQASVLPAAVHESQDTFTPGVLVAHGNQVIVGNASEQFSALNPLISIVGGTNTQVGVLPAGMQSNTLSLISAGATLMIQFDVAAHGDPTTGALSSGSVQALRTLGNSRVRFNRKWTDIETSVGNYQTQIITNWLNQAQQNTIYGYSLRVVIDGNSPLYGPAANAPISTSLNIQGFVSLMKTLWLRFAGQGIQWQILSNTDSSAVWTDATASWYATLCAAVIQARNTYAPAEMLVLMPCALTNTAYADSWMISLTTTLKRAALSNIILAPSYYKATPQDIPNDWKAIQALTQHTQLSNARWEIGEVGFPKAINPPGTVDPKIYQAELWAEFLAGADIAGIQRVCGYALDTVTGEDTALVAASGAFYPAVATIAGVANKAPLPFKIDSIDLLWAKHNIFVLTLNQFDAAGMKVYGSRWPYALGGGTNQQARIMADAKASGTNLVFTDTLPYVASPEQLGIEQAGWFLPYSDTIGLPQTPAIDLAGYPYGIVQGHIDYINRWIDISYGHTSVKKINGAFMVWSYSPISSAQLAQVRAALKSRIYFVGNVFNIVDYVNNPNLTNAQIISAVVAGAAGWDAAYGFNNVPIKYRDAFETAFAQLGIPWIIGIMDEYYRGTPVIINQNIDANGTKFYSDSVEDAIARKSKLFALMTLNDLVESTNDQPCSDRGTVFQDMGLFYSCSALGIPYPYAGSKFLFASLPPTVYLGANFVAEGMMINSTNASLNMLVGVYDGDGNLLSTQTGTIGPNRIGRVQIPQNLAVQPASKWIYAVITTSDGQTVTSPPCLVRAVTKPAGEHTTPRYYTVRADRVLPGKPLLTIAGGIATVSQALGAVPSFTEVLGDGNLMKGIIQGVQASYQVTPLTVNAQALTDTDYYARVNNITPTGYVARIHDSRRFVAYSLPYFV